MSTLLSDWPSAPDFHPEFGLLCPSPRRRRSLRLAMACVIAGMAIGATMELAVAHWRDSDAVPSPAVRSVDEESPAERAAARAAPDSPVASARPSESAAGTDGLIAPRPQGLCKDAGTNDPAAAFLNPTCGSGKAHARRGARTTYRVATLTVGRTDSLQAPTAAEPTQAAVPSIEPSHTATGTAGKATASIAQPVEGSVPPKKPKVAASAPIILTPPTRESAPEKAGASAFAAMPPLGRGYSDRPGAVPRAALLPPSVGGPFGGIW
jgi:hypothetical protein